MRNRLCCEVDFGKQPQAEDRLLQRSDAISGSLFSFISEPKNQSSHSLVSPVLCFRPALCSLIPHSCTHIMLQCVALCHAMGA